MTIEGVIRGNEGDVDAFLEGIKQLQRHFKLYVAGCGCCESPYITSLPPPTSNKYLTD